MFVKKNSFRRYCTAVCDTFNAPATDWPDEHFRHAT